MKGIPFEESKSIKSNATEEDPSLEQEAEPVFEDIPIVAQFEINTDPKPQTNEIGL